MEARKARSDIDKTNQKIIALATKTVSATAPLVIELDTALKKKDVRIPEYFMDKMQELFKSVVQFKNLSQDRLGKTAKAAAKGSPLDDLGFTPKEIADVVREAQLMLSKYKKMVDLL